MKKRYMDLILLYTRNRTLSYPYKNKKLDKWIVSRYKNSNDKIPFYASCEEDIIQNENIMRKRGTHDHFGMYSSNYRYKDTQMNYYDLTKNDNTIDYNALIDIDNTRNNLDLFKHVMRVLIYPKLPKEGVYGLCSGNGHHIRIIGFKSHLHASKYINENFWYFNINDKEMDDFLKEKKIDMYTYSLLKEMTEVGMHVDLLNDIGRISTVPYSRYKYNKNVLCVPFEVDQFENYRNSWSDINNPRIPHKLDLWNVGVSKEVIEYNKQDIKYEHHDDHKRYERIRNVKLESDCYPDCIKNAVDYPFSDGRRRIIMLLAAFHYSISQIDDVIYDVCHQRNATFKHSLPEDVVNQIVSEVLRKGLACPKCSKIVDVYPNKSQYPYLSLGDFNLCKHIPNGDYCLKKHFSPVNVYNTLIKFFSKE